MRGAGSAQTLQKARILGRLGPLLVFVKGNIMRRAESAQTLQKQGFWAVGASSCSCQKECHEVGRKCPSTAKSKDSGAKHSFLTIQSFPK